jgi:hypothetical protein
MTTFTGRLGFFLVFLLLTIITIGFYPLYFYVTRLEAQTELLREIARNTAAQKAQQ